MDRPKGVRGAAFLRSAFIPQERLNRSLCRKTGSHRFSGIFLLSSQRSL